LGVITGEEARTARLRAGKTQQELADIVGMSVRSVNQWERTGRLSTRAEVKVRQALGAYLPAESSQIMSKVNAWGDDLAKRRDQQRFTLEDARQLLHEVDEMTLVLLPKMIAALEREQRVEVLNFVAGLQANQSGPTAVSGPALTQDLAAYAPKGGRKRIQEQREIQDDQALAGDEDGPESGA
jgi:transcriptional regulator with XRE-family HTH domain